MVKMTDILIPSCKDVCKEPKKTWTISTTRANLKRDKYSCLLAIPNFRWRVKAHRKDLPSTETGELLWPISKAALNAKCSRHIEDLFDLAYRPKHFAREHAVIPRHSGQGPYEGGHWASPAALTAPMKIRITHLAVPKRCRAKCTKKFFGSKLTERQRKLLDTYIDNATKTVYYRKSRKKMPKTKGKPHSKADFVWPRRKPKGKKVPDMERLSKLATPKVSPPQQEIPRGKKVNLDSISDDLAKLATPPARLRTKRASTEKYYQVKPGALTYNITDRIAEIAQPKQSYAEGPRDPYTISPAALNYEASSRVVQLAAPSERKAPPNDDIREEPFAVNPVALKAMCSARIAELATPRGQK